MQFEEQKALTATQVARLQDVITAIVAYSPSALTPAKVNKLLYIAELKYLTDFGIRLTEARILHHKHGPWSYDVDRVLDILHNSVLELTFYESQNRGTIRLITSKGQLPSRLSTEDNSWLKSFVDEWSGKDLEREIIPYAYSTLPFFETRYQDIIDLDKYVDLPESERQDLDYAPGPEMRETIDWAVNVEISDEVLESMNAA